MRNKRGEKFSNIGQNGYFRVLSYNEDDQVAVDPMVKEDVFYAIDQAENNLNLESLRMMVTTVVYLRKPNHDSRLMSERLLEYMDDYKVPKSREMKKLRNELFDQGEGDLVCLGKLVPNVIRDQDNLILELILPEDLAVEDNQTSAAKLLAPFLYASNHMIFDL